jgi:1-acyl-sn-glycerol-3-phosphate acyltransferase
MGLYPSHNAMAGIYIFLFDAFVRSYTRPQVLGGEHIPDQGAYILAANHASHADTAVLFAALPRAKRRRLLAAAAHDYFFDNGLRQHVVRALYNVIPVDRDGKTGSDALRHVVRALREGYGVLIFPEGTRSRDGKLGRFRGGIGRLAAQFPQVPIIPVYLDNTEAVLPKGKNLPTPVKVRIFVGEPLYPEATTTNRASWQAAADQVREAIVALQQQAEQPAEPSEPAAPTEAEIDHQPPVLGDMPIPPSMSEPKTTIEISTPEPTKPSRWSTFWQRLTNRSKPSEDEPNQAT